MNELLQEYLTSHGYWVLFVWTFLEGEAGLILAGFLAFQGYFTLPGVMATAFCGAVAGDQFYFYLGRYRGRALLTVFSFMSRRFHKALRLMERYGSFVAFISRYTYGLRILLPIILGMTNFSALRFLLLNLASASVWALLFASAGYLFGKGASLFVGDIKQYEQRLMLVLACIIAAIWSVHVVRAWWSRLPARRRLKRMKSSREDR
jgi:membrane protein DedA with SNARE-associated domain